MEQKPQSEIRDRIRVELSNDYYSAYLSIINDPDSQRVTEAQVMSLLKEKSVTFGIDKGAILRAIASTEDVDKAIVAQGIPHQNGEDAELAYSFEMKNEAKPEVLEDGTVDFKNLGIVKAARKGDVLAEKKPATEAIAGTTVTGKSIKGRNGRDKVLPAGKNTHISENGLVLYADIDGKINFDGRLVSVLSVMEIKGDVGVSTGNIDFVGSMVVNGNICDGYEVKTSGDLTVNGVVEGAKLNVGGNLNIAKGIKGHDEAVVTVEGDVFTNFINATDLNVKGKIEANAIISSNVKCDGEIILSGKKGQLTGGEVTCKGDITAKAVGSNLEVITNVRLGLDYAVVSEMKDLATEMKEVAVKSDQLSKDMVTLANKLKLMPDNASLKLKFIKHKKELEEIEAKQKERQTRLNMLQELAVGAKNSRLKAGVIHPGVRVSIGKTTYTSKFEMKNTIIKKDKAEIVTIGY